MSLSGTLDYEMFALFEMTPDLVCIAGKDGYFRKVNPAVIHTLEYNKEELFSRTIDSLIHPEDREFTSKEREKLLAGNALLNFQNRYISKTGTILWLEWTSVYIPDKEIVFAIAKDITRNKQKEKETEEKYHTFKTLATHFKSRVEEDRKFLAYELHEEVAQLATVVKMNISWLGQHLNNLAEPAKGKIEDTLLVSDLLVRSIKKLSFSISPNMLEDLGLNATLQWEAKEFAELNGIPCYFNSDCLEDDLSKEIKLDFYRVCEEALSNVREHAEAKTVRIVLEDLEDRIALSITDDGKGFDGRHSKPSAGLQNLHQLAISINGKLNIDSETGKGTTVKIVVEKT
ncbi:MAG: PAS domain S-box protein [Bacteroidota bacterium]